MIDGGLQEETAPVGAVLACVLEDQMGSNFTARWYTQLLVVAVP
jgi:hypothetical protein